MASCDSEYLNYYQSYGVFFWNVFSVLLLLKLTLSLASKLQRFLYVLLGFLAYSSLLLYLSAHGYI